MNKTPAFRLLLTMIAVASAAKSFAANSVVWESSKSLIDTTNFSSTAPYYWFANFANPSTVTGVATDNHEARNLPSWIHLESRPAFIGKDDSGLSSDSTPRTGYSFAENGTGTIGDTSIGGQPGFNTLTLPGGQTGISGEVADSLSTTGNTSSFVTLRIDSGAPSAFRIWVITDNGSGANFQDQARLRVNLRDTAGPPLYVGDLDTIETEALPAGVRIGQTAQGHDGIADAWSFLLGDVNLNDIVTIKATSATGSLPAIAGILVAPVPEPSTLWLGAAGVAGLGRFYRSRRSEYRVRKSV